MADGNKKESVFSHICWVFIIVFIIFFVFTVVLAILLVLLLTEGAVAKEATVALGCHRFHGTYFSHIDAFSFRGIRFAEPPTGEQRWKPPIATPYINNCTSGMEEVEYQAIDKPPACYQRVAFHGEIKGSEDCLFLNVFTPSLEPEDPLPVLVFIHGGYLQYGDTSTPPGYNPDENTAAKLGIVIVSIQYRLNAFGFLVTEADSGTGNYAILDQIAALKWVRDNIAKFGGDNQRVTLLGHSSGGTSIFALITSPKAKDLFHGAIMSSGSPILNMTLQDARVQNRFFLQKTNCSDEKCLRNLDASVVVEAIYPEWDVSMDSTDLPNKNVFEPALLIIDGNVLKVSPFDAWDNKQMEFISDVPLMVGSTAQEMDFEPAPSMAVKNWTNEDLYDYVSKHLDAFNETYANFTLTDLYASGKDPEHILTSMIADVRVNCGCDILSKKAASAMKSVYRYIVTYSLSQESHPFELTFPALYAFHGLDLYALHDTIDLIMSASNAHDRQFVKTIQENLIEFIVNGEPADKKWAPYPATVGLFDRKLVISQLDYNHKQCQFWNNNGFFSYSWIN